MLDATTRRLAFDRRLLSVRQTLDRLTARTEALTPGACDLLGRLTIAVDRVEESLDERWSITEHLPQEVREKSRRTTLTGLTRLLRELAETLLPQLEGSLSTRTPVELHAVVKRLAREAGVKKSTPGQGQQSTSEADTPSVILFAHDTTFNYLLQPYPDPADFLPEVFRGVRSDKMPTKFVFVGLPRLERDSALLHSVLLGHELGHRTDQVNLISGSLAPRYPSEWTDAEGNITSEFEQYVDPYHDLVREWAGEFVADVIAALVLGPVSLAALSELLLSTTQLTEDSATHPALDRRAAVILGVLDESGFDEVPTVKDLLAAYRNLSDPLTRAIDIAPGPDNAVYQRAWEWLRPELPKIVKTCRNVLAKPVWTAKEWPRVERVAAELAAGYPCGELVEQPEESAEDGMWEAIPVDEASILNAGWLVRVKALDELAREAGIDWQRSGQRGVAQAVLDDLVLKSLEIAEHRRGTPWSGRL